MQRPKRPTSKRSAARGGPMPTPKPMIVRHWVGSQHADHSAISLEQAREVARHLLNEDIELALRRCEDAVRREAIRGARRELFGVIGRMALGERLDYKPDVAYSIELLPDERLS